MFCNCYLKLSLSFYFSKNLIKYTLKHFFFNFTFLFVFSIFVTTLNILWMHLLGLYFSLQLYLFLLFHPSADVYIFKQLHSLKFSWKSCTEIWLANTVFLAVLIIYVLLLLHNCSVMFNSLQHGLYVALQALLSMGFSRQECWKRLSFPSPGDLPDLEIKLTSPALASIFFTTEPPGKPNLCPRR